MYIQTAFHKKYLQRKYKTHKEIEKYPIIFNIYYLPIKLFGPAENTIYSAAINKQDTLSFIRFGA